MRKVVTDIPRKISCFQYSTRRFTHWRIAATSEWMRFAESSVSFRRYDKNSWKNPIWLAKYQLHGFVEPINKKTGMPYPFCFPARCATEIIEQFAKGKVSGYLNTYCDGTADKEKHISVLFAFVRIRQQIYGQFCCKALEIHRNAKLNKVGISILTISSDSHPRYNSATRELSSIGENLSNRFVFPFLRDFVIFNIAHYSVAFNEPTKIRLFKVTKNTKYTDNFW